MKLFDTKETVDQMQQCRKKVITHCKQINEEFEVQSLEGRVKGKAGDYLMRGIQGELYICDQQIFNDTYELISD